MPPAAEPVHERVVAAVVAALASIVAGGTYFYDAERSIADPYLYRAHLDASLATGKTSFVVSHDDDEDASDSFTDIGIRVSLDVAAYQKFVPASEGPWNPSTPKRGTVQARIAADVKNKLRSDEHLGALGLGATQVWIPHTDFGADVTLYKGWAVVFMRVVIDLTHGQVGA